MKEFGSSKIVERQIHHARVLCSNQKLGRPILTNINFLVLITWVIYKGSHREVATLFLVFKKLTPPQVISCSVDWKGIVV